MKMAMPPEESLVGRLFDDSRFFLDEAKRFEDHDEAKASRHIRASIITAFAALEALANVMLFVVGEGDDLELVERAFVEEKRVELAKDGYFAISKQRHLHSVEEKIRFLNWRIKGVRIPKGNAVWKSFVAAERLRNEIVHPKPGQVPYSKLTVAAAESCLTATLKVGEMLGWYYW